MGFGTVLKMGGNWYLNVPNENAPKAAEGCFMAAGIYACFLLFCGYRVMKLSNKKPDVPLDHDD